MFPIPGWYRVTSTVLNGGHLKYIFKLLICSFIAQITLGFESAPQMIFVGSNYSGHEEITRQALNSTALRIRDSQTSSIFQLSDLTFDLTAEPKGLFGYKSKNMVIHGNFATDFPKQTTVFSLSNFWKDRDFDQFENPKNQDNHFLRNYKNSVTLESAKSTCYSARAKIKIITQKALELWAAGNTSAALFLVGHAAHTIQDSFSRAHAIRDDSGNYDIRNICFFGAIMQKKIDMVFEKDPLKKVCYHATPDSKDAIWNYKSKQAWLASREWADRSSSECDSQQNYPDTEEKKQSCLSHEARLAKLATEKYLFLVFNEMNPQSLVKTPIDLFVESLDSRLFDGPVGMTELDQKMANGIMRCEGLSDQDIVGTEPRENY